MLQALSNTEGFYHVQVGIMHSLDLRAGRMPAQRRGDFLHEMLHVIADWQVYSFERARRIPE
jgi:hypothetical protein